jgi:hypothetical protein
MQIVTAMLAQSNLPLTAHEALSGVFGSVSLAAWIFLLVSALFSRLFVYLEITFRYRLKRTSV